MQRWYHTVALAVLLLIEFLMLVIGVSALFVDGDPSERDADWLIATFAAGMGLFALAMTLFGVRRGERWAWLTLWYVPAFFIIHVGALGTFVPDLVLAVVFAAALLGVAPTKAKMKSKPGVA